MPKPTYKWCRGCRRHVSEVGVLSHTRLCEACGRARFDENWQGIHLHRGPAFHRWRETTAASVGAVLLDTLTAAQLRELADALDAIEHPR